MKPLCAAALLAAGLVVVQIPAAASKAKKPKPAAVRADSEADTVNYGRREDVAAFAASIADKQGLDPAWVQQQLAQARYIPSVARLVMPAATGAAKNWWAYRERMVDAQRVQQGARWWQDNERWLAQAEARYGVPPEFVVAIVGVETYYGRMRGGFRILDALATLSFDFPTGRSDRSPFFRDELAAFLRWCANEKRDPLSVKGSYAGAIGLPQFMPSSILKYAVDFDDDGSIDLEYSAADAIGSVARYLAQFGWQAGVPTHFGVVPPASVSDRAVLLLPDITPSFTAAQMGERGAQLDAAGQSYRGTLALVELQNGELAPTYVAGTGNFYVITRYNWSAYYAMAVTELAQSVRRARATMAAEAADAAAATAAGPAGSAAADAAPTASSAPEPAAPALATPTP